MIKSVKRILVLTWAISVICLIALKCYKNLFKAIKGIHGIFVFRKKMNRFNKLPKYYHANKRYFMTMNIPGFPSESFNRFISIELNKSLPFQKDSSDLQLAVLSITSRCPMHCLHCYEWERINGNEYLTLEQLLEIQRRIEKYGVSQIQYSGGEPMIRINELTELIKATLSTTDTWVFSSGYNFKIENVLRLKQAGLTGIVLSLDHWKPEGHNHLRQSDRSFDWVSEAARQIVRADLALSLSLCATRDFVNRENLLNYVVYARNLKAGFIQILEPRKVGHFKNSDVELYPDQINLINDFVNEMNNHPKYSDMPTILFPGYHQREFGCFGGGDRFLYIDSKGNLNACPFCQESAGSCLDNDLTLLINNLKAKGCPKFPKVPAF